MNSVYKVEATVSSLGSRAHMAPHHTSIIQKSGVMRDLFCATTMSQIFSPNSYDFYHNSAEKEFEYEIRDEIYLGSSCLMSAHTSHWSKGKFLFKFFH